MLDTEDRTQRTDEIQKHRKERGYNVTQNNKLKKKINQWNEKEEKKYIPSNQHIARTNIFCTKPQTAYPIRLQDFISTKV